MQIPNKLFSYEESTLSILPTLLNLMQGGPTSVLQLYEKAKKMKIKSVDFINALDCLYALNAVEINDSEEVFLCL